MIRVSKITSGINKGKFEKPSQFIGNSPFANLADSITEQFQIITEGKDEQSLRSQLTRRKGVVALLLIVLVGLTCKPHDTTAVRSPAKFDLEAFQVPEINKLASSTQQQAIYEMNSLFFKTVNVSRTTASVEFWQNPAGFRKSIESSEIFKAYQSYLDKVRVSAGIAAGQLDDVKLFLEAERMYVNRDRVAILQREEETKVAGRPARHTRTITVTKLTCIAMLAALIALILTFKLLTFFFHMKLKQAKFMAKRFLAFENQRLNEFGMVAIEDLDLLSLSFVSKVKPAPHFPQMNLGSESLMTEMSALHHAYYA